MTKNMFDTISENFHQRSQEHAKNTQKLRKENEHRNIASKVKKQILNENLKIQKINIQNPFIKSKIKGRNVAFYLEGENIQKFDEWKQKNYNISKIINELIKKTEL